MDVGTVDAAAERLAALLTGSGTRMTDLRSGAGGASIDFAEVLALRPLRRSAPPADVWAVDGGQITVVDARCLSVVATRAATVRFRGGACEAEDEGEVRVTVLGPGETADAARAALALDGVLAPDCSVDANLVRDRWEWAAAERAVEACEPGGVVLIDGDLQPDWRIPSSWLSSLLDRAFARDVVVAAVTKHSSLARGGAPLLGQLELEAAALYGPRATWWTAVGKVRTDVGDGIQVLVARLDPDARYSFRVDVPGWCDAEDVLSRLSGVCDDAAFPGYPYPLTVADRLAACPGWLGAEVRMQLDDAFDRAGVPHEVRARAFDDRHRLMERA